MPAMRQGLSFSAGAALLVSVAVGCGGAEPAASPPASTTAAAPSTSTSTTTAQKPKPKKKARLRCRTVEAPAGFRTCQRTTKSSVREIIQRRVRGEWKLVSWEPAGDVVYGPNFKGGMSNGMWTSLRLSPDGRTLLGQWSSECEVQYAFFIPAAGGKPRVVTGEDDFRHRSPESSAKGWASAGRARVFVIGETGCGGTTYKRGDYLIDPTSGEATWVGS
jgi:hypothetical protein